MENENELPEPGTPKRVSPFEARMLRILRFCFQQFPQEQGIGLINSDKLTPPPCLSEVAVELIQDTLKKGMILYLIRAGAWRNDRFVRNGKVVAGRLWERIPLAERILTFSPASMNLLIWITANKPAETKKVDPPNMNDLTLADALLVFRLYAETRIDPDALGGLRTLPCVYQNPLCWLAFPEDFGETTTAMPAFRQWVIEPGSFVLEALERTLTDRWLNIERTKGAISDWGKLRNLGQVQGRILDTYIQELETANRPDLARFILRTASQLLSTPNMSPTFWTGGLRGSGPPRLADRLETQRMGLAMLRCLERLRQWERRARTIGYFDEGYAVSQLWKNDWENLDGDTIANRANTILHTLDPLRAHTQT